MDIVDKMCVRMRDLFAAFVGSVSKEINRLFVQELQVRVLIYDVGGNWEHLNDVKIPKDLQNSVGAGIRFRAKWFVARLDYGYPLNKNKEKREGRFHFGAGVPF